LLAYGVGLGEDLHNLLRRCVGGYVVVGGLAAQEEIADTSSGQVGLVSLLAQGAYDFGGVLLGVGQEALSIQHSAFSQCNAKRCRPIQIV